MSYDRRPFLAMLALAAAFLAPGPACAVESRVIAWKFELPYWESSGGQGQFGGYIDGRFEVVVAGDSISVRNFYIGAPIGLSFAASSGGTEGDPTSASYMTSASPTSVSVGFDGPPEYCYDNGCVPKYYGSFGVVVEGDLTKSVARIPVIGGGYDYHEGHYSWYYGSFAPGPDSFVVQVPEAATWVLTLAGLTAIFAGKWWARRRQHNPGKWRR